MTLLLLLPIPLVASANQLVAMNHALPSWVDGSPSPLWFLVVYILAQQIFISSTAFCIAGGALYGPVYGTLLDLTGAAMGAAVSFLVSRHLLAGWLTPHLPAALLNIRDRLEDKGWRSVALLRLLPLFPYAPLNYTLGLTRLSLSQFLVPTVLCIAPRVAIYAYLGYAGREAIEGNISMVWDITVALGVLVALAWLPQFFRQRWRGKSLEK